MESTRRLDPLTVRRQQRSGDSHLTNGDPRSTALHAICRLWAWRDADYGRTPRHAQKAVGGQFNTLPSKKFGIFSFGNSIFLWYTICIDNFSYQSKRWDSIDKEVVKLKTTNIFSIGLLCIVFFFGSGRAEANTAPTTSGTIPTQTVTAGGDAATVDVSSYFSDADGDTLTYTASASFASSLPAAVATVSVSSATLTINGGFAGTATITVTATDPGGLTATQSFSVTVEASTNSLQISTADALPVLSSEDQLLLGALITYDTLIFNELYNASDDANDWLELRNVSAADLSLEDWHLSILIGDGNVIVDFPRGTVIPAGEVLLLVNTAPAETSGSSVVVETFALPQEEFALILRGSSEFGDLAVNYFQAETQPSETAPVLTVGTVWHRNQPIVSGYLAEAWSKSSTQDGLGTPGYRHASETADLNNDGMVNILDLVLVASQFGMNGTPADLNNDGTVNIQDLVLVANRLAEGAAAPAAQQSTSGLVNTWLRLAREQAASVVQTSIPEGFSYERGIQVLEQLTRALVPEKTALLANYPNPFNPETWIPYQLAKAADVTVSIYASNGMVVRTLVLGHQDAGVYKNRTQAAYWDGKNDFGETVASGLYFYTLTAGDFTATRRMLIVK